MRFENGMRVPLVGRVRINFFLQMVSEQVSLIHETHPFCKIKKNAKSLHPTV